MRAGRFSIIVWMAAFFAGLGMASAESWSPDTALVAKVEKELVLPRSSKPLKEYKRYYFGILSGKERILGAVFVYKEGEAGALIVKEAEAPQILDGGCGVIHLKYDVDGQKVISLFCNGEA